MLKNKFRKFNTSQGFTLVELLVVILIIGVLSGLVLSTLNSQGIREKSKDGQRKADLKTIQVALELYHAENRTYPNSGSGSWLIITGGDSLSSTLSSGGYLQQMPVDPDLETGNSGPCSNVDRTDTTIDLTGRTIC